MSWWAALDSRRKAFAVAAAVVGLASVGYAVILREVYFGQQAVTAIDDVGEAVAAAIAAGACVWASRRAGGRDRLRWGAVAAPGRPLGGGGARVARLRGGAGGAGAVPLPSGA